MKTEIDRLLSIEPEHRLVVLARTLNVTSTEAHHRLKRQAGEWRQLSDTCLGRSLYSHHSIVRGESDVPAWSHVEFTYFREIIPVGAIAHLIQPTPVAGAELLRAELLLTTPGSFAFPASWSGSSQRPDPRPSIE